MTKLEQIQASVERNYSTYTLEEKKRIVRQMFVKWLAQGRTIGSKLNLDNGKIEYTIEGENIALLI